MQTRRGFGPGFYLFLMAAAVAFCLALSYGEAQAGGGPKDKKGADGWLHKSQRQYLEYKFKQDHGRAPVGRDEIRWHEQGHPHYPVMMYWNGYAWVYVYR